MNENLQAYLPGAGEEAIPRCYYSTRRVASITNSEIQFFNYVQGGSIDSITATKQDTNLKKVNAIESPNRFWLKKIDMIIIPVAPIGLENGHTNAADGTPITGAVTSKYASDINKILVNGLFSFVVSAKEKFVLSPINELLATSQLMPPGYFVNKRGWVLKEAELLLPEINFTPTISFGTV